MRVGHAVERHGPAGAAWRPIAGAGEGRPGLDLEVVRRRLLARQPERAHNAVLFRQPITTLDEHLSRGLRIEALAELVDGFGTADPDDEATLEASELRFGPPVLRPPAF